MVDFVPAEKAMPIRQPSTALLTVSSRDRNKPNEGPYNFTISKSYSIVNGFFTRVGVTEVNFPWVSPNIYTLAGTGAIKIDVSGGNTYDIDVGGQGQFLNCRELATVLQAELIAGIGAGWTCTFDTDVVINQQETRPRFTITAPGGTFFSVLPFYLPNQATLPQPWSLFEMMGWDAALAGVAAASHTTTNIPSMLPTQYIDIVSPQLTYAQDVKDGSTNTVNRDSLCRLYLTECCPTNYYDISGFNFCDFGSRPFNMYRQFNPPKQIRWDNNLPVGNLTFQVYDDNSRIPDIAQGISRDWNMTLQLSEV